MCNANPLQKTILNSINSYTTTDLENFLKLHNFELRCFLDYRIQAEKLNSIDIELIKKHVDQENISLDDLKECGMTQVRLDEIYDTTQITCPQCDKKFNSDDDFNAFKQYCSVCNDTESILEPIGEPLGSYYDLINNNDPSVTALEIRRRLNRGEITKEGLISKCGLSIEIVDRLAKFYTGEMTEQDVTKLPPLKSDQTDFYFLGMPAAGKSCLVASLLAYWHHIGIYNPDVNNPRSLEYTDLLLEPFELGYLPDRTESGFIDYINGQLQVRIPRRSGLFGRDTTRHIPINIIDMAGEAWRQAAEKGSGLPQHKKYLDNNNEKSIIVVIDCSNPESTRRQARNIVRVFQYFADWKIWEKTASVAVVISKADKLIDSKDYENLKIAVEKFYNSPACINLKNRIDELSKKHRFDLSILPYSIGACKFGQLLIDPAFETNILLEESTKNLNNWILQNTGGSNSGGFSGLFSN